MSIQNTFRPRNVIEINRKVSIVLNTLNQKTVNPFGIFAIFIVTVILSLPFRVYQLMANVQSETGFWKSHTHFSVFIFYVLIAFGIVMPIVMSLIYKKGLGKVESNAEKKPVGGVLSFAAAVGLVVDAIVRYTSFSNLYFDYTNGLAGSQPMMTFLSKSGALAIGLEAFFAVVSAIFFLMLGIAWLTGKDPSEYKLLAIMPVFWSIFRIMHRFMRKISFLNVSELFLELLMIVFLMMFFMAFAQITANVNGKGLEWKLFAYGLPGALFCLLCFVPRVVVTVLGHAELISADSSIEFVDLTMAAFVLFVLVDRSRVFRKESKKDTFPE